MKRTADALTIAALVLIAALAVGQTPTLIPVAQPVSAAILQNDGPIHPATPIIAIGHDWYAAGVGNFEFRPAGRHVGTVNLAPDGKWYGSIRKGDHAMKGFTTREAAAAYVELKAGR